MRTHGIPPTRRRARSPSTPERNPDLAPLERLLGTWECEGRRGPDWSNPIEFKNYMEFALGTGVREDWIVGTAEEKLLGPEEKLENKDQHPMIGSLRWTYDRAAERFQGFFFVTRSFSGSVGWIVQTSPGIRKGTWKIQTSPGRFETYENHDGMVWEGLWFGDGRPIPAREISVWLSETEFLHASEYKLKPDEDWLLFGFETAKKGGRTTASAPGPSGARAPSSQAHTTLDQPWNRGESTTMERTSTTTHDAASTTGSSVLDKLELSLGTWNCPGARGTFVGLDKPVDWDRPIPFDNHMTFAPGKDLEEGWIVGTAAERETHENTQPLQGFLRWTFDPAFSRFQAFFFFTGLASWIVQTSVGVERGSRQVPVPLDGTRRRYKLEEKAGHVLVWEGTWTWGKAQIPARDTSVWTSRDVFYHFSEWKPQSGDWQLLGWEICTRA